MIYPHLAYRHAWITRQLDSPLTDAMIFCAKCTVAEGQFSNDADEDHVTPSKMGSNFMN